MVALRIVRLAPSAVWRVAGNAWGIQRSLTVGWFSPVTRKCFSAFAHKRKTPQSHRTSASYRLPSPSVLRAAPALRFSLPHPQNRAVQEDILICAFPSALHPLGQPSVARPTGFPALRFPTRQLRMEPRADLEQRSNPSVDSLTPVRLTLRAAFSSLPRSFPSCLGHLD
jgi:hypothetical protein